MSDSRARQERNRVAEVQILRAMLEKPNQVRYAYDLMRDTHQGSATLVPALARLCAQGLLIKGREPAEHAVGRPPRVSYRVHPDFLADAELRVLAHDIDT